ncbi:MAG: hemerythrin domain-containing protein, partial [Kofleriaceae bacterium]
MATMLDGGSTRRRFVLATGSAVLLAACRDKDKDKDSDEDVGAVEDLMREHGVIRRVLVVYRESAARLRTDAASVPPDALQKAARLFRSFGEDYHERLLEEAHIFPAVKSAGGAAAAEIATLLAQHQRGRELTDFMLSVTARPIGAASAEPLARALEGLARMYEEHAAREDTIVFPAWKKALSKKAIKELGEQFEDIEKKTFGKDRFDDAVEQVTAVERAIGLDPAA